MSRREVSGRRRLSVPEVLQSSLMDCGPAALKAVLEGFGIQVGYDALRERCQTDVDGTSIDALAELSRECGLMCHRVLMPMDHLLLPEARSLPAIVTVRSSGGAFHFVVVWRRWGSFVQIMDPSSGRKWRSGQQLLGEMPVFTLPVSTAHFRRWARSAPA
jgi:ATP-binding cassette subfamily B protein